jgi:phage-related protein
MKNPLWNLVEYPKVLSSFRRACKGDKEMLAALADCLVRVRECGPACGMPTSEFIEDGVYQIRPKTNQRQGRILYIANKEEKKITFLCGFFKKTQATPRHFIDLAKTRRQALMESEQESSGRRENG